MDFSYLTSAGIFVQLALLFYVLGLLARNELWLRGLILTGTMCYILYYYFISDTPLWDAILASSVIGLANLSMIIVILRERSTIGMSADMLALYQSFPTLNPGQFRKVMKIAERLEPAETTQICTRDMTPQHLYLITQGSVAISRGGKPVHIGAGNFIGEISFLLGSAASADVVAPAGTHYVRWERDHLTKLMDKSPRISNAIAALFNQDIARKLSVNWPEYETI